MALQWERTLKNCRIDGDIISFLFCIILVIDIRSIFILFWDFFHHHFHDLLGIFQVSFRNWRICVTKHGTYARAWFLRFRHFASLSYFYDFLVIFHVSVRIILVSTFGIHLDCFWIDFWSFWGANGRQNVIQNRFEN